MRVVSPDTPPIPSSRTAVSLGAISAAAIILAFLQQWLLLVMLGPGRETDSFFAALAVPQLILAVLTGSLAHVLVPLLSGGEPNKARADAKTLVLTVAAVFLVVTTVLWLSASWWAPALFPGFTDAQSETLVALTRIQLIGMALSALGTVFWAYSYSRHRFVRAELSQVLATLLSLCLLLWVLPRFGILAAAWVWVLRSFIQLLILTPEPAFWRQPAGDRSSLREAWRRLRPLLVGTAYYKTDPLLDRVLSSLAPGGILTLVYFGQQLWGATNQVIATALGSPVIPMLSTLAKERNWEEFRRHYNRRLRLISVIAASIFLVFLVAGGPALHLLIGHGGLTGESVSRLWLLMVASGGAFIFGVAGQITSVAFYARGDTSTPTRLGIVTFTLYVPLKVLAFHSIGVLGLQISTSIFFLVNFVVQHLINRRQIALMVTAQQRLELRDDFTRHGKLEDLGRWYVTRFVSEVASALPARTRILDAGAGECAYKHLFNHCRYTSVDLAVGDPSWNYRNLSHVAPLDNLPFAEGSFDAVLCTQVLEHLEEPLSCLKEIFRVLEPGGTLFLTAPMAQGEHQVPYDYFRYTSFGLRSLLTRAGFQSIDIKPFGGMFVRWAYELPRAMTLFPGTGLLSGRPSIKGILLLPPKVLCTLTIPVAQSVLLLLDRFDRSKSDPFGWALTAVK